MLCGPNCIQNYAFIDMLSYICLETSQKYGSKAFLQCMHIPFVHKKAQIAESWPLLYSNYRQSMQDQKRARNHKLMKVIPQLFVCTILSALTQAVIRVHCTYQGLLVKYFVTSPLPINS